MTKLKPIEQLTSDARNWDIIRIVFKEGFGERVGYYRINSSIEGDGGHSIYASLIPTKNGGIDPWDMGFEIHSDDLPEDIVGYEILKRFRSSKPKKY